MQSFSTAFNHFKSIDSSTRGIIVPYNEGKELINSLVSSNHEKQISQLLRKAQNYSINLFQFHFNKLFNEGKIFEIQEGLDIYYLANGNFDETIGLCDGTNNKLNF